jgi:hypothetical protein
VSRAFLDKIFIYRLLPRFDLSKVAEQEAGFVGPESYGIPSLSL